MKQKDIKNLVGIKSQIREGIYQILLEKKWEDFVSILSTCGASLLDDIEKTRDKIRNIRISFLFFRVKRPLEAVNFEYDEIIKNYDLFFDASMRFFKCIIDGDRYRRSQKYMRKYLEELVDHCKQSSDYLGNLISSKRNEYSHNQSLFLTMVAISVAVIALLSSIS